MLCNPSTHEHRNDTFHGRRAGSTTVQAVLYEEQWQPDRGKCTGYSGASHNRHQQHCEASATTARPSWSAKERKAVRKEQSGRT